MGIFFRITTLKQIKECGKIITIHETENYNIKILSPSVPPLRLLVDIPTVSISKSYSTLFSENSDLELAVTEIVN